ncbi:MAG: carboxypeptidase-like regulatory domain-containing protein [Patescibacteria group bacterium]|jgi:hypothetical protein
MKKLLVIFLLVITFLLGPVSRIYAADTAQNVLVSCLDAYVVPDPHDSRMTQYAGLLLTHDQEEFFNDEGLLHYFHLWRNSADNNIYAHVAMLKNKVSGTQVYKFEPTKSVSILREHQGEFTCAVDKDGVSTCPDATVPTFASQGYGMDFKVLDQSKTAIMPAGDGTLTVPHVMSWTSQFLDQNFFGMQILTNLSGTAQTDAVGLALKLATFTPQQQLPDAATNCVSVQWDPYGRVIDAKTLEPVQNMEITLFNKQGNNKVQTVNPQNPMFLNPYKTVADGTFNFAIPAGTYYLTPKSDDFTFPTDAATLEEVVRSLKVIDPNGIYIDTTRLYSSIDEEIVEKAGMPERRDVVVMPKNANYTGSNALIETKNVMHDKTNYIIKGMVSHPKTIVRALINGVVKTQMQTDADRQYILTIPESVLPDGFDGNIGLEVEKLSLISTATIPPKQAVVATEVALMPTSVTGFAVSESGAVIPRAIVEIVIPKLANASYAFTNADADGFFVFNGKRIPTFPFVLRFTDPANPENKVTLSPQEFARVNKAYFAETKRNMYTTTNEQVLTAAYKPKTELVTALKQSFARTVSQTPVSPTGMPSQESVSAANQQNALLPLFAFFIVLMLGAVGGLLVFLKKPAARL